MLFIKLIELVRQQKGTKDRNFVQKQTLLYTIYCWLFCWADIGSGLPSPGQAEKAIFYCLQNWYYKSQCYWVSARLCHWSCTQGWDRILSVARGHLCDNTIILIIIPSPISGPADELPGLRVLRGGSWSPRDHVSHEDSLRQHLHSANKWVVTGWGRHKTPALLVLTCVQFLSPSLIRLRAI